MNNLSYRFGDRTIFNHIDMKMKSGEIYIIKGQSGSGKTTLLNILAGYLTDYEGELYVPPNAKLEYVFQEELLFENLTVKENMKIKEMSLEENGVFGTKKDFIKILGMTGIAECINSKVNAMSGGEKQRLQIAKAILGEPDIILLDEPTSKLDGEYAASIAKLINDSFKNILTIIVTHDDIAKYFENVCVYKVKDKGLVRQNAE